MKKRRRVVSKIVLTITLISVAVIMFVVSYFFAITAGTNLDNSKLNINQVSLAFTDASGQTVSIDKLSGKLATVKYDELQQHTIDAFVSAEDKRFFDHKGIDYIRVAGAIKNNIFHPKHKQGGSTITQQVIKNTQLSSEKTIERKLKEFKLAKQMEKQYSKQQIMEIYLNSIYFGNGCYGLASASRYYFDKPASELTAAESALLASTINAPSVYDPVSKPDKAHARKNLILGLMQKYGKLDKETAKNCKIEQIDIKKAVQNGKNQYYKGVIAEACKILKITESQLISGNYQIDTYYNSDIQQAANQLIASGNYTGGQDNIRIGAIVLDNHTKSVVAVATNSNQNILATYRQPGSTIKPIIVYAPAYESGRYSPATFVNDDKVNINGYSPENASKTYNGMVTARESLARSLNVPAVKIMDSLGIASCKSFARGFGIEFDKNDNNLALALGGFTKGTTIKQLADGYMTFANGGKYCSSAFISKISRDGTVLYERAALNRLACSPATSYLVTSCLQDAASVGTSKRLADLNLSIASKTGTVGTEQGNTDAYNISYTTDHTICCWIGSTDNSEHLPASINGATYPTLFVKAMCQNLYSGSKPEEFDIPKDIVKIGLNQAALAEYKLEADSASIKSDFFNIKYAPKYTNRDILDVNLQVESASLGYPILSFDAARNVQYRIFRKDSTNVKQISTIKYSEGKVCCSDSSVRTGSLYEYWVEASCEGKTKISNHIKVVA